MAEYKKSISEFWDLSCRYGNCFKNPHISSLEKPTIKIDYQKPKKE
jgi:hypothetical protein